jgi:hypothetical protein
MEIGKEVDGRAVLAAWLRNDWNSPAARQEIEFRLYVWNVGADLIERPRLDRPWDHWVRVKLLEGLREPVWERLPEDIRWMEATAAVADVAGWYARPGDTAWEILSGGSGRIADVAACARAGDLPRGCPVREAHRCQTALDSIKRIARGMDRRPIADPFILLAPAEAGPCTILDGHKRAAAAHWVATLDGRAQDVGPLTAYVGVSPQPSPFRRT